MENNKKSVPASVRIAFIVFLALGFILIGALWMKVNEKREENELLKQLATEQAEENARLKDLIEATMNEDYARVVLPEYGYYAPGNEYYPNEVEP